MYAAAGLAAFSVILSQTGFVFLEVGHSRTRNGKSFIAKHFYSFCLTILVWWFWGYGFALDSNDAATMLFEGSGDAKHYLRWVVTLSWVLLVPSIVCGAVTDRLKMWAYGALAVAVTGVVCPLIINWLVVEDGWLEKDGVIDWAGAGYIHLVGGTAALVGARMVGPRSGRFVRKDAVRTVVDVLPYDTLAATTGTWVLIFALFNLIYLSGLDYGVSADGNIASARQGYVRAVIMAAIAMGSSGLFATITLCLAVQRYQVSLQLLNNAMLGGLVAISAGCGNVDAQGAFFIGMGSGIVAFLGPNFALHYGIDDPRDTITVHFWQAVWGLFAVGLWASKELTFSATGSSTTHYGAFYSDNGVLLGCQIVYILVVVALTVGVSGTALGLCELVSRTLFAGPGQGLAVPQADASKEVSAEFPYLYEQAYGQSVIPPGFKRIGGDAAGGGHVVNLQQ